MKKILIFIIAISILMMTGCGSTNDKSSKIEFSNVSIKCDSGRTRVLGEAKNIDKKSHNLIFKVNFYDENNKLLDVAEGVVNDIASGETKTFETMGVDGDHTKSKYKVQIDAID